MASPSAAATTSVLNDNNSKEGWYLGKNIDRVKEMMKTRKSSSSGKKYAWNTEDNDIHEHDNNDNTSPNTQDSTSENDCSAEQVDTDMVDISLTKEEFTAATRKGWYPGKYLGLGRVKKLKDPPTQPDISQDQIIGSPKSSDCT
jgi:hypothetical protein